EAIVVVEKPHQLLSVPGIKTQNSVLEQVKTIVKNSNGPIIVHRLDWATSGLMVFIDEEDKQKPYPDDKLAELLKEKGYPIARRTVAKYRDQLNIPVERMRKKI